MPDGRNDNEASPVGVDEVAAFLRRPDVTCLLRTASRDVITGARLQRCLAGTDITPEQARGLLESLLEGLGVPITRVGDFQYWLYPTAEIRRCLHVIDTTCTADSELSQALREHPAAQVRLKIITAIASSRLDGIEIDFQSAKDLLLLTRTPRNDPERIVSNSFELYGEVADYAKREPSVGLYLEIFERLTRGVSTPADWLDTPQPEALTTGHLTFSTSREVLEKAVSISRENAEAAGSHDAITSVRLNNMLATPMPFPMLNGTMGRLAMHIHAVRAGFPILGVVPFSDVFSDWKLGRIGRSQGIGTAYVDPRGPLGMPRFADSTPWTTAMLQLILYALAGVRAEIRYSEDEYEACRHLLDVDPTLNPRQRSVLGHALEVPDALFRIAYHKTLHDVAYSTARADFTGLEERGLLRSEREGHSFVYRAVPDLAERIGLHGTSKAAK